MFLKCRPYINEVKFIVKRSKLQLFLVLSEIVKKFVLIIILLFK